MTTSPVALLFVASSVFGSAEFVERDGNVIGSIDGQEVFVYHVDVVNRPDAQDSAYARSGFVHPLKTLAGTVVTDDFPPDHLHQNGLFSTHVNATFQGRRLDFWNRKDRKGTFRHAKLIGIDNSLDGSASFTVVIEHVDDTDAENPIVVIEENRMYRLSSRDRLVIVDMHAVQRCATEFPVILNKYKYGGAALRGARHWTSPSGANFVTDAGLDRADGNHTKSIWFQLFGPTKPGSDEMSSITAISHPANFRYPEPVRLHPAMPYGVFAPCVAGEFRITPDEPLEMRYRYVAADGRPDADLVKSLADDFAESFVE